MPPLYPPGRAGVGLLLLRLSVAGSVLALSAPFCAAGVLAQIFILSTATALCLGIGVRAFALLSLAVVPDAVRGAETSAVFALLHATVTLALSLLGAGAYALDALLFGRRRVKLSGSDDTSE